MMRVRSHRAPALDWKKASLLPDVNSDPGMQALYRVQQAQKHINKWLSCLCAFADVSRDDEESQVQLELFRPDYDDAPVQIRRSLVRLINMIDWPPEFH